MGKNLQILLGKTIKTSIESILLFFVFVYLNISSAFGEQFPDVSLFEGKAWRITWGCGLVIVVMFMILYFQKKVGLFFQTGQKNIWLILFLILSALSLSWTVNFPATLYELMLLFFATFSALFLAVRYGRSGFIEILSWIAACTVMVSLWVVFFTPFGIMRNEPFVGSWDGLFWHRNHAGSLMAFFNMIFLLRILLDYQAPSYKKIAFMFFYLLTAVHVFGSRSATGILIFLLLNASCLSAWAWMKFHQRLETRHYYLIGALILAGFVLFVSNLGFFFGLLGRSANMTGRVPLWKDLFLNFYLNRPFLGHGYGAIWMQESFRVLMQARHDWTYPVYFADNGYLDILLNLGAVGLIIFLALFFKVFHKSVGKILETHSWEYIFTFMILLYVLVANLAYSFLLEVDHFVWVCLLVVVFLMEMPDSDSAARETDLMS